MADDSIFVLICSETVFEVSDPASVHAAATRFIHSRDYGLGAGAQGERAEDLERAAVNVAEALLELADPGLMVPPDVGTHDVSASTSAQLCNQHGHPFPVLPDFAVTFSPCGCGSPTCDRCSELQLTARTAALLYINAQALADTAYDDVIENGDEPVLSTSQWTVFDSYPRITYRQNAVWRRQAARAFDDLADDLARGLSPQPRCIAEEMALRLTIGASQAMQGDARGTVRDLTNDLPADAGDYDWGAVFESLMQDDDLGQLFRAEHDGIEDPNDERNQLMGIGDYRPVAWFDWFGNVEPRDGRRPFRR